MVASYGQTHSPVCIAVIINFDLSCYAIVYIHWNNSFCSNTVPCFAFSALTLLKWHPTSRSCSSSPNDFIRKVVMDLFR